MANPVRKYDYDSPPSPQDPFNPIPPADRSDPLGPEPLTTNLSNRDDIMVEDRPGMGTGNMLLIAAVIVILAAVAFYIFGPGSSPSTPAAPEQPAATAPADNGTAPP